ncbi:MAG: hypothetical protein K2X54_11470 [Methylobacterium organophilum]|nr:hypothetical protein [Methylobacterium organophilum]
MKALLLAAALAAAPAPQPGLGPGRWLVLVRQTTPDGARLARLTFERLAAGTRWGLRCYDTTVSPPEIHQYDGLAPREDEWVMGDLPTGGHFTMSFHGDPLWASWIRGCPAMGEPDVVVRVPGAGDFQGRGDNRGRRAR